MRALVTGSTGFIGRRLCAMLIERGDMVVVAKRGDDLDGIMRTTLPDVVFHLAGAYTRDHEAADVANLVQSNVEYGVHVLEAMRVCGIRRIVVASTLWALEDPVNLYAATKKAFETILDYYRDAHGFSPTVLYLGDTYGPDDRRGKIVSRMVEAAITGEALDLSPGDQVLDLAHVDDVCRGLIHAATHSYGHSHWSLSSERVTLRALAAQIQLATGKPLRIHWGARAYHPREVMNPARTNALPGWHPSISLRQGLMALVRQS